MRKVLSFFLLLPLAGLFISADFLCPDDLYGNVNYFPHPTDCHKFLECNNGQLTEMECPDDLVFNPELKVCDFLENVGCGGSVIYKYYQSDATCKCISMNGYEYVSGKSCTPGGKGESCTWSGLCMRNDGIAQNCTVSK